MHTFDCTVLVFFITAAAIPLLHIKPEVFSALLSSVTSEFGLFTLLSGMFAKTMPNIRGIPTSNQGSEKQFRRKY
jgi:hypothetical protein